MDNFQDFITLSQIRNSDIPGGTKLLLEECYKAWRKAFHDWKEETKNDPYLAMEFFGGITVTFAQELDCREMENIHPFIPQLKRLTYTYTNALNDYRSKRTSQSR